MNGACWSSTLLSEYLVVILRAAVSDLAESLRNISCQGFSVNALQPPVKDNCSGRLGILESTVQIRREWLDSDGGSTWKSVRMESPAAVMIR